MGLRELKSELKKQDKEMLIKHIPELYKKYKPVKEYFDFYINPNENELLKEYKESILERFKDRSEKIVSDTSVIGWGFHDYLAGVFYEFYSE